MRVWVVTRGDKLDCRKVVGVCNTYDKAYALATHQESSAPWSAVLLHRWESGDSFVEIEEHSLL